MAVDPRLKREKNRAANEKKQKEEEKKKAMEEKAEKERVEREQMEAELAKKKVAEGMSFWCIWYVHLLVLDYSYTNPYLIYTHISTSYRLPKEGRQEGQGTTEEATS